jgi:hypothetical protein
MGVESKSKRVSIEFRNRFSGGNLLLSAIVDFNRIRGSQQSEKNDSTAWISHLPSVPYFSIMAQPFLIVCFLERFSRVRDTQQRLSTWCEKASGINRTSPNASHVSGYCVRVASHRFLAALVAFRDLIPRMPTVRRSLIESSLPRRATAVPMRLSGALGTSPLPHQWSVGSANELHRPQLRTADRFASG